MKQELSPTEHASLKDRNLTPEKLNSYGDILKQGYPFIKLAGACQRGKEIQVFDPDKQQEMRETYGAADGLKVVKFVPASGAASRMFKDLYTAWETGKFSPEAAKMFENLDRYAFAEEWLNRAGFGERSGFSAEEKKLLLDQLLSPDAMNYGNLPKGMIPFHKYPDGHVRTAFEEHFHEGALYARSGGETFLHFTVPADNRKRVEEHLSSLSECLGRLHRTRFHIETSVQKPSTDTPAIYADSGDWVRREADELLFRPAGHGALLENLNDLKADLVFVKNIDNVVPDSKKKDTHFWKEVLAGVLLTVQKQLFKFLNALDTGNLNIEEVNDFTAKWFGYGVSGKSEPEVRDLLHRPLRVCGMVKNEGEPGGGPFLVSEKNGEVSLQIVEGAQINPDDKAQKEIASGATHFNPVDLVLGLKDYQGNAFRLFDYRNDQTGMVVHKNHQGRNIRALELPGLWNGSMHFWNTVFVEVPISTFNPVKTVFDLSREAHQS